MIPNNGKQALRIICADDQSLIGDVLVRLFTLAGHIVERFNNGLNAWERMSQDIGHFDVLITEHEMRGLTGLELVERLRQSNYRGRIIVHSGSLSAPVTENYRTYRVDAIVAKGTEGEELLKVVEAFHEKRA